MLELPLEICVVRKLVAKGPPPVTIGAVAEGDVRCFDETAIARAQLSSGAVDDIAMRELIEVERRAKLFRDHPAFDVRGRDVILVDDGLLTGLTARAAVGSLREHEPSRITLAVPVANESALASVRGGVDYAVCLETDSLLTAIGGRYADFFPVSEAEVIDLLAERRHPEPVFSPAAHPQRATPADARGMRGSR